MGKAHRLSFRLRGGRKHVTRNHILRISAYLLSSCDKLFCTAFLEQVYFVPKTFRLEDQLSPRMITIRLHDPAGLRKRPRFIFTTDHKTIVYVLGTFWLILAQYGGTGSYWSRREYRSTGTIWFVV
jgi:hypothetical protein